MAINLYSPLVRKSHVDERLRQIEAAINSGKLYYLANDNDARIEARIQALRESEKQFFAMFGIKKGTTKEMCQELNARISNPKTGCQLTTMNGAIIQEAILDICSSSYHESLLNYLREKIVTDQMLEEQVGALGNDATWVEALISFLNNEITKSTGKQGRLHTDTKGLAGMSEKKFKELTAKQLTSRAKQIVEKMVTSHIRERGIKEPVYEVVIRELGIEVAPNDWRGLVKGLTPSQAKVLIQSEETLNQINETIIKLILNHAAGANQNRLRNVIQYFVLNNPNGKYAFFVGKNDKAITGLLGEIQGLYYICSLFGYSTPQELASSGKNLLWLADTYGNNSKKMSIDILLENIGIQVKNTSRELTDPYANVVSFSQGKFTLQKLAEIMGLEDTSIIDAISSLFQTYSFNVEYQFNKEQYVEESNPEFNPTRLEMERLIELTESMFALWMEAAMHIGINYSADVAQSNANTIYFVNGLFYGASDILQQLYEAVDRKSSGFRIIASPSEKKYNIVNYLNEKKRKQSMYGVAKSDKINLKITTSFDFGSLL